MLHGHGQCEGTISSTWYDPDGARGGFVFLSAQTFLATIIPLMLSYFYQRKILGYHISLLPQPQISFTQRAFSDYKNSMQRGEALWANISMFSKRVLSSVLEIQENEDHYTHSAIFTCDYPPVHYPYCFLIIVDWLERYFLTHSLLSQASLVVQMVKNLPAKWETWVQSLGWEELLEKGKATHSSTLAWRIPWTEEPGRLHPWGHKESDTAERLPLHFSPI